RLPAGRITAWTSTARNGGFGFGGRHSSQSSCHSDSSRSHLFSMNLRRYASRGVIDRSRGRDDDAIPQDTRHGILGDRGGGRGAVLFHEFRTIPLVPQPVFRTRMDGSSDRRVLRAGRLGGPSFGGGQRSLRRLLVVVDQGGQEPLI